MRRLSDYQAIIVDMDGTLYYQKPVRRAMLREMLLHFWRLQEFLIVYRYRKLYERGLKEKERLEQLPEHAPVVILEWMIRRPLPYVFRHRDTTLIALLQRAEAAGTKVIVYSDYSVTEKLKAMQYHPSVAFCAEDTGCLKPDASGLISILLTLDIMPEQCLVIGDRWEKDGIMAAQMGADCLILQPQPKERMHFYMRLEV